MDDDRLIYKIGVEINFAIERFKNISYEKSNKSKIAAASARFIEDIKNK